mmetsp:Transcript_24322/g.70114  ORF Transcript_24322/g.70114 Transcript_24322/m.70114 type:complete len:171 (-) Transcript_24322:171-683(-)
MHVSDTYIQTNVTTHSEGTHTDQSDTSLSLCLCCCQAFCERPSGLCSYKPRASPHWRQTAFSSARPPTAAPPPTTYTTTPYHIYSVRRFYQLLDESGEHRWVNVDQDGRLIDGQGRPIDDQGMPIERADSGATMHVSAQPSEGGGERGGMDGGNDGGDERVGHRLRETRE